VVFVTELPGLPTGVLWNFEKITLSELQKKTDKIKGKNPRLFPSLRALTNLHQEIKI